MDRFLKTAELRDLESKVAKGEISYSKMVEEINLKAYVHYNTVKSKVNFDNKTINELDIHFKPFQLVTLSNNVKVGLQFEYSLNNDPRYPLSSKESVENIYLTFNKGNSCIFLIAFDDGLGGFKRNKIGRITNLNEQLEKINKTLISKILSYDTLKNVVISQQSYVSSFKTTYWSKLEKMFREYKDILINESFKSE